MTRALLRTGRALMFTGSLALKADRLALGLIVLAAAADAVAQPHYSSVDPKISTAGHATHAASTLLTTLERLESPRQPALPANLEVHDKLRPLVELMWQRSPTFARQCARLARAPVQVILRLGVLNRDKFRALSRVNVDSGRLKHAHVEVDARDRETVELVAHELEHVIEQLDGVDLASQITRNAASQRHGVGLYETRRAVEMGRRVAAEVRRYPRVGGGRPVAERR